jgi:hypothetical protein
MPRAARHVSHSIRRCTIKPSALFRSMAFVKCGGSFNGGRSVGGNRQRSRRFVPLMPVAAFAHARLLAQLALLQALFFAPL